MKSFPAFFVSTLHFIDSDKQPGTEHMVGIAGRYLIQKRGKRNVV